MSAPAEDDQVYLRLEFHDSGKVGIWTREGMPGDELAELLRQAAAGFDTGGSARRIE